LESTLIQLFTVYTGDHCSTCDTGYYTNDDIICTSCPVNCLDQLCNEKGTCTSGCQDGYYGAQCNFPCSRFCVENGCNWETWNCI